MRKSSFITGLILLSSFLAPFSQAASRLPIPDEQRIPLLLGYDRTILDLRTDGLSSIYWVDGADHGLRIIDINTGKTYQTTEAKIFDLSVYGDRLVSIESDRNNGFHYANLSSNESKVIEPGHFVDGLYCFDGDRVGYISENSFWIYDIVKNTDTMISEQVNGSLFYCSLSENYVSYNGVQTGGSTVYLHSLTTGAEFTVSDAGEGRSSVVVGNTVYYDEMGTINAYDIGSRTKQALFPGEVLDGYMTVAGVSVISFMARDENTLVHPYLYFPQYDTRYRLGNLDYFAGIYSFSNGLYVWTEMDNGKVNLYATRITSIDSDLDTIPDLSEFHIYTTNPLSQDTDGDGYTDDVELKNGFSPLTPYIPGSEPSPTKTDSTDLSLTKQVAGKILLQVESNGEAWYVDPVSLKRYYMRDGADAFTLMRSFGLGISNADLAKIPEQGSTDIGDKALIDRLRGRIVLQVESKGEAWYINPSDGKRYYLRDGEAAYTLMRSLGLGITNTNLNKIPNGKT